MKLCHFSSTPATCLAWAKYLQPCYVSNFERMSDYTLKYVGIFLYPDHPCRSKSILFLWTYIQLRFLQSLCLLSFDLMQAVDGGLCMQQDRYAHLHEKCYNKMSKLFKSSQCSHRKAQRQYQWVDENLNLGRNDMHAALHKL